MKGGRYRKILISRSNGVDRMGRPRDLKDEPTEKLEIDIPQTLKRRVKQDAGAKGMTLTAFVVEILDKACNPLIGHERSVR